MMRHKDIWTDTLHGVHFEIARWKFSSTEEGEDNWNYYIFLNKNAFTEEQWGSIIPEIQTYEFGGKERKSYDYYNSPIAGLPWHCGITYFEKISEDVFKVGCDYSHLYDEGMHYSETHLEGDAKITIRALVEMFPDMKRWCAGDGKWRKLEEFEKEDGQCVSKTYSAQKASRSSL